MKEQTGCPSCGSHAGFPAIKLYDDRYGHPGMFDLMRCSGCGHKYLSGQLPGSLVELYTRYYQRADFDIEKFRPHTKPLALVSWLNGGLSSAFLWVPCNVRVLDIGCGMGETLAYHASRGCEVYGVDADANILRVGEKFSFNVHAGEFDASLYEAGFFDFVTLDQVIEHVPDPRKTLLDVSRVMKNGGTCVLSMPNANGWGARIFGSKWLHWHAPYHLHFFSPASIERVAAGAGLRIERLLTITRSEWLLYQVIHLFCYPVHGKPSFFWVGRKKRSLAHSLFIKGVMSMRFTLLPQLVTRLFDALGVGDNYVVVLKKTGEHGDT